MIPGAAYVRGWLRTYAGELGLDADELVDAYRSAYEDPRQTGDRRRGPAARRPNRARAPASQPPHPRRGPGRGGRRAAAGPRCDGRLRRARRARGKAQAPRWRQARARRQARQEARPRHGRAQAHRALGLRDLSRQQGAGASCWTTRCCPAATRRASRPTTFTLSLVVGELKLTINGDEQSVSADEGEPLTWEITPHGCGRRAPTPTRRSARERRRRVETGAGRNRRHRDRGADRSRQRPQRPLGLAAPRGAGGRGRPHHLRRRPARGPDLGAAVLRLGRARSRRHQRRPGADRRRPHGRGRRRLRRAASSSSTRRWRPRSPRSCAGSRAASGWTPRR